MRIKDLCSLTVDQNYEIYNARCSCVGDLLHPFQRLGYIWFYYLCFGSLFHWTMNGILIFFSAAAVSSWAQFQRGRRPRGERWVLGLFDTQYDPARPYLQLVRRRDARTLLTIIQRHVQPGSLVYTDEWAAYRQMQRVLGFNHQTVNHSVNFVDPITGVHTQHAESNWSYSKKEELNAVWWKNISPLGLLHPFICGATPGWCV